MKHTIPEIGRGPQPQLTNRDIMMSVLQTRANCIERAAIAQEKEQENRIKGSQNKDAADNWARAAEQWQRCDDIAAEYEQELERR